MSLVFPFSASFAELKLRDQSAAIITIRARWREFYLSSELKKILLFLCDRFVFLRESYTSNIFCAESGFAMLYAHYACMIAFCAKFVIIFFTKLLTMNCIVPHFRENEIKYV